ncbi:hypothetical protein LUW74_27105 [Actinomadura madurae]|uniref:hypothetical protein n=1 Tax=Actinomadura madurae TaxID=1993 RepID=UPI0020267E32|nr:hypothetical protein [Actinomadura madurae]URN06617.1 hypothetical protein LUW74_27105 [Actinomadura madurae]
MPEPSVAPDTTSSGARDGGGRDRLRRAALLAVGFAFSYGLVLTLLSDVFFWFAIPGLLGLVTVVIITLHLYLHRPFGHAVPYATDGTDREGPVRHHYAVLTRRYLLIVVAGATLAAVPLVLKAAVAYPLIGVGIVTLGQGTRFFLDQILWMRKCARVLKVYDFEFRSPVQKSNLRSRGRRSLTLGTEGAPRMAAREPLFSDRWPREIARGVWFAGDEPFGGAILVPDTGELMCMQPENWSVHEKARQQAGAERREKAARAGLARQTITA